MSNIKAICFDYGGVLSGESGSVFDLVVSDMLEVSVVDFKKAYFSFNKLYNTDKITQQELWNKVCTVLDRQDRVKKIIEYIQSTSDKTINPKMGVLLKKLRKSYKIGVLSNNIKKNVDIIRKNIEDLADVIVISCEVGMTKPDKEIFTLFFNKLDVKPEEVIFIDDAEKSLSTATEIGYTPILFTSYDKLVDDLNKIGIGLNCL